MIRYILFVGSILLGGLLWFGHGASPQPQPTSGRWTAADTLRAMAHHGDPETRRSALAFPRTAEPPVRVEQTESASLPNPNENVASHDARAAGSTDSMNAHAEMAGKKVAKAEARKAAAARYRKRSIARHHAPSRTQIAADNPPASNFFGFTFLR